MKRRDFIKRSFGAGFAVSVGAGAIGNYGSLLASQILPPQNYDLAAVKGGEPAKMFDLAIDAFGGMKKYVAKNQTVVVKPNIGWDVKPEGAANTNPKLVTRIIEHCFEAGAKDVYVFDHTCDNWQSCYSNSGIEKAVKDAGGKMVPGNSESYYHEIDISGGKKLVKSKVHELILESDVFINVPVLKHHSGARLTIAMKNLMGIVWDRGYWHSNDLDQCIADFPFGIKPDLNIVDAYQVLTKRGPRGVTVDDVVPYKSLLISKDIVAVDAAASKIFGHEPDDIGYIRIADSMKLGTKDLSKLSIKRIIV